MNRRIATWLVVAALGVSQQQAQAVELDPFANGTMGVSISKPTAYQGYSLVAPMNSTSTYLIDMDGRIVHEWKSDYTPAFSAYLLEDGHLLRPANSRRGDFGSPGMGGRVQEFDWDGTLVWDYEFTYRDLRPHHDVCPLPNGNVLVVASDPKTAEEAIAAGRRPETVSGQLLPESIVEVKPTGPTTGEVVWEWHAWDHLVQDSDRNKPSYGDVSEHPELIDVNFTTGMMDRMLRDPQQLARLRSLGYVGGGTSPGEGNRDNKPADSGPDARRAGPNPDGNAPQNRDRRGGPMQGDWMHVNSVAYNAELDQVMISVHEFSEVWIIDHSTTTAEAASHQGGQSGKGGDLLYRWGNPRAYRSGSNADQRLFAQHCAHWIQPGLPGAGHMLVFNNGSGRPDGSYSSVDEITLPVVGGVYEKEEYLAFGPDRASWIYTADNKPSFHSQLISGAQRLPNGNTYICSGNQAILFEVAPSGEIVWMFKYPGGGGPPDPGNELVPDFLRQMLRVSDEQSQAISKLDDGIKARLEKLLTAEQLQQLQQFSRRFAGPGGFRPPQIGQLVPPQLLEDLKLSPEQTAGLKELQLSLDRGLAAIWSDEQKEQIKQVEAFARGGFRNGPPPGFGPAGPPPGGPRNRQPDGMNGRRGPRGFGGGPGGIFRSYRYGSDYAGLAKKTLTPGKRLEEVVEQREQQRN